MKLNETHHAYIVLGFYRELMKRGQAGYLTFIKGAQLYGESRGRRMAMRAIRDGNPLNFTTYFAYGEWESSPDAFDCTFEAKEGYVDENVTRCPEATGFAHEEIKECGMVYCKEIDRAIVRGFNPELTLEVPHNCHDSDSCQFYFRDSQVRPGLFEEGDAMLQRPHGPLVREFAYHCADVWCNYCNVVYSVFGDGEGAKIVAAVRRYVADTTSEEVLKTIERYVDTDFNRVS